MREPNKISDSGDAVNGAEADERKESETPFNRSFHLKAEQRREESKLTTATTNRAGNVHLPTPES